jgi:hypothetical protein
MPIVWLWLSLISSLKSSDSVVALSLYLSNLENISPPPAVLSLSNLKDDAPDSLSNHSLSHTRKNRLEPMLTLSNLEGVSRPLLTGCSKNTNGPSAPFSSNTHVECLKQIFLENLRSLLKFQSFDR